MEAPQSTGEALRIEAERSFGVGQLSAVLPTPEAATVIPITRIVEAAAIILAEFIVAAPS
jgi:hypothetical protein